MDSSGYKKSPQWQKAIIDRVIKKMAGRASEGSGNPLTRAPSKGGSVVDLAAVGLTSDMATNVEEEKAVLPRVASIFEGCK